MKYISVKSFIFFAGTAATLFVGIIAWKEYAMKDFGQLTSPQVKAKNHEIDLHGVKINDPYAWLRDAEWKTPEDGVKNQEILDYLKAENMYTDAFFKPLASKVKEIFEERRGFLQKVDESVPIKRDNYFYYSRQMLEQNYPVYLRKKDSLEAAEEIIMDVNVEAKKHSFFTLGGFSVSPSHQLLAYTVDTTGNEFFELKIRDLSTGNERNETIPNVNGGVVWNADNSGFYYTQMSTEWRPKKLFHHKFLHKYKHTSFFIYLV